MKDEFEYYCIYKAGVSIPLIKLFDDGTSDSLDEPDEVKNPPVVNLYLQAPVPRKLPYADLLTCPALIFSEKLSTLISSFKISGIQLIPAQLLKAAEPYTGTNVKYSVLHAYSCIKCINEEESDADISMGIMDVKKLVLDKKALEEIPLEERLLFTLEEDSTYQMFHKSIVDKILEVDPVNVRFVRLEDITNRTMFGR